VAQHRQDSLRRHHVAHDDHPDTTARQLLDNAVDAGTAQGIRHHGRGRVQPGGQRTELVDGAHLGDHVEALALAGAPDQVAHQAIPFCQHHAVVRHDQPPRATSDSGTLEADVIMPLRTARPTAWA
jgi:hypothetical protein